MPNINGLMDGTCVAKEDLTSDDIGKFVVLSEEREVSLADVTAGARTYGVLKTAGDVGEAVTVQLDGISAIQTGTAAGLSAGDPVKVTVNGDVELADTDGDTVVGILRQNPSSDASIISAQIIPGGMDLHIGA